MILNKNKHSDIQGWDYILCKQQNGKWKVKKVTYYKSGATKKNTIAKDKTHYEAETLVNEFEKNL